MFCIRYLYLLLIFVLFNLLTLPPLTLSCALKKMPSKSNSSSSSKNRRIKKHKNPNSEIKPVKKTSFWFCRLNKFTAIFLPFVLYVTYCFITFQPRVSLSEMLRAQIDAGQSILDLEEQLLSHLEKPVPEFIKTKLKPLLHRLSSIRTQVHQYEKMERIPGGPVHFIATTTATLDAIETEELLEIKMEVDDLITENGNVARGFIKANKRHTLAEEWASKVTDLKFLAGEGIEITPSDEDWNNFVDTVGKGLELSHILDMYRDLAEMYQILEDTKDKMTTLSEERGILDLENYLKNCNKSDETDGLLSGGRTIMKYRNASKEEVLKNREKYKLLTPFKLRVNQNIRNLNNRLDKFDHEINGQCIELLRMAREDIRKLRVRLENLKHKYLRIPLNEYSPFQH